MRRGIALRCTPYSAVVLVGFVILGEIALSALEIRLSSFQFAGGVLLFLFGIKMVFGDDEEAGRPGMLLPITVD